MAIFGDDKKEFFQLSAIEKRLNWDDFVGELIRIQTEYAPSSFSNEDGILAYNLLFPEEELHKIFPNLEILPWPATPQPFAANASHAAIRCWDIESKLLDALRGARTLLKNVLTAQCRDEVLHLKDKKTGYHNVPVQAMFLAASKAHGQLTPVDHGALRLRTTKSFNRADTLGNNLGRWMQAHQGMTRTGISVSESDKYMELTALLRAYHSTVAGFVDDYEKETDLENRAWLPLFEYVELRELRLNVPLIGGNRGQLHSAAEDEESTLDDAPSAAAASPAASLKEKKPAGGGSISISTERLKELEEAEKFVKAAPVPQYCFTCGWGGHGGQRCMKMSSKDGTLRDGFTKKQTEAKKPATVDGKTGATKLWAGFRKPN